MTVKEVPVPFNRYCKSGHQAPVKFARRGTQFPEEITKFFLVSSDQYPEVNGVYCEPCLILANAMTRLKV
jgi:hypothetical protein